MSEIADNIIDGLLEREAEEGAVMTWPSGSAKDEDQYPCCGSDNRANQQLDIGGYKPFADITIVVRISLFSDITKIPKSNYTIGYTSVSGGQPRPYRIRETSIQSDAILVLSCVEPSQGV